MSEIIGKFPSEIGIVHEIGIEADQEEGSDAEKVFEKIEFALVAIFTMVCHLPHAV